MPWAKGQSGNRGGRPKVLKDVVDLARQHTKLAIETLVTMCTSASQPGARVAAASALLDKGYGKPPQHIEASVEQTVILATQPTDEEWEAKYSQGHLAPTITTPTSVN